MAERKKSKTARSKSVQVDNTGFNAEHYAGVTEATFIKDQMASVPDSYGDDKAKTEYLKKAYAKINPPKEVSK